MRPRCCLRYFTFFGINIGAIPASGYLVIWLFGHLVIWSSGYLVIWHVDWTLQMTR
jgi:hypothetical protein